MNASIARALLQDAYYQVLDNKVFRLLVLISIVLIAPTFLIGFREDGIHLLFGWKFFTYAEFLGAFGGQIPEVKDLHVAMVQGLQALVVEKLAGTVGVLFCIAATAFFVPRMLEKGAADTLFTKPVSRFVLLLSRYLAGLIFVAVLAFTLVLGMHLGLLITSGYSDPGFLWSALTLVYVFGLVQAVSVVVAVFTRSSTAAILCTLIFFTVNGCIHRGWVLKEHDFARNRPSSEDPGDAHRPAEEEKLILKILVVTLDGLHYALPKTIDADVLTRKLRTVVVGRSYALEDEAGRIAIEHDPEGFVRQPGPEKADLLRSPASWVALGADGVEAGRMTLSRRSRVVERPAASGKKEDKPRTVRQSASQAANELVKSLEGRPEIADKPVRAREASGPVSHEVVRWGETGAQGARALDAREHLIFGIEEWMVELDVRMRSDWIDENDRRERVTRFVDGMHEMRDDADSPDPEAWYEARFGWTAPLRYNASFSLGSSIAFALVMLAIARWRLGRIDF